MPSVLSTPIVIDPEWAATLVGLRMKVPEHWWAGCTGNTLCEGEIAAIDFTDNAGRYFQLELDDEKGSHYAMRYDAVLHYADEEHKTFSRFRSRLLSEAPPNPTAGEGVRVRQQIPRQPIFRDNDSSDEDENKQPRHRNKRS